MLDKQVFFPFRVLNYWRIWHLASMQPRDLNIARLKGARFKLNRIKYQTQIFIPALWLVECTSYGEGEEGSRSCYKLLSPVSKRACNLFRPRKLWGRRDWLKLTPTQEGINLKYQSVPRQLPPPITSRESREAKSPLPLGFGPRADKSELVESSLKRYFACSLERRASGFPNLNLIAKVRGFGREKNLPSLLWELQRGSPTIASQIFSPTLRERLGGKSWEANVRAPPRDQLDKQGIFSAKTWDSESREASNTRA